MILTVLVNAHREGRYLTAALRSVEMALAVAELELARDAEVLLVLDRPDELTVEVAETYDLHGMELVFVDHGDLGKSRNEGTSRARGRYTALLDGDDVWGAHWISRALADARIDSAAVLHPQISVSFPDRLYCWQSPDMSDPAFHTSRLLIENCWTSLATARTDVFRAFPYKGTHDHTEYGYEDWAWNCDTIAAGHTHHVVPRTAHFIRKRSSSLSASSARGGALTIPHELSAERARALTRKTRLVDATRRIGAASGSQQLIAERRLARALEAHPELFDPHWYEGQLPRRLSRRTDPLRHFMEFGRAANLSPGPWLDSSWYWRQHPDVASVGQCAYDHYTLHGEQEGRPPHPTFLPRLSLATFVRPLAPLELTAMGWRDREGHAENMDPAWLVKETQDAVGAEPQLGKFGQSDLVRGIHGVHFNDFEYLVDNVIDALQPGCFLILVPHFKLGGADRVAANMALAAAESLGEERVVVISTDDSDADSIHWFPTGVRVRRMQKGTRLDVEPREMGEMLANLLLTVRPSAVLNVNSLAAWVAFRDFGMTLKKHMRLMATQFCRDQFPHGGMGGYGDDYLRETIDALDVVLLDHQQFGKDLVHDLGLISRDAEKMRVAYTPPSTKRHEFDLRRRDTRKVLWVGRLVGQKRPDLVAEIAGMMPDIAFEVYGGPLDSTVVHTYGLSLPNITMHGPLSSVQDLNPLDFGALLLTSLYEGVPVTAIDVGAWGLPIVASQVGGLREVIDSQTGWPLPPDAGAADYVLALRQALDVNEGFHRGAELQHRIEDRHSWDQFRQTTTKFGLFDFGPGYRTLMNG